MITLILVHVCDGGYKRIVTLRPKTGTVPGFLSKFRLDIAR
jgi:hypothetical protein